MAVFLIRLMTRFPETVKRDIFEANLVPFARISSNCAFLAKNIQGVWTFMASYLQVKKMRNLTNIISEKKTWKRLFWPILAHFSQNPEEWDSSSKTLNKTFFLDCFLSFMANFRKNLWKPSMKKSPQTYEPKGGQADGQAWFHKT